MENRNAIIAAACHSAWYGYTVLALGEEGQPWETAPEWQKASIMDGVEFWDKWVADVQAKGTVSFDTARKELPPLSHQNWLKHKKADGWHYGTKKNVDAKIHPCMVPYSDLPASQKKKDHVVVEAYLAMIQVIGH